MDAVDCTGHGQRLPDAEQGHTHVRDVFVTRLGFAEREVCALMGAHVLGRAERANSGYDGAWVQQNDQFTNAFFEDLVRVPWNKRTQRPFQGLPRTQWDGRGQTLMLNTDMEMAWDTSSGCTRAGGNGGDCPRAAHDFSSAVDEFADNRFGQASFFAAFAPALKRLTALGSSALTCPFADCSTPGPFGTLPETTVPVIPTLPATTSSPTIPEATTPVAATPLPPSHVIASGDSIFLRTHSGSSSFIDIEGVAVRSRWGQRGNWQALVIEKEGGGTVNAGDAVFSQDSHGSLH